MRSSRLAYGLSILSASACLFFGPGWTQRTIVQALVMVMIESFAASLAALLIAAVSRKAMVLRDRGGGANLVLRSIILGLALSLVGGALEAALAAVWLGGAPDSVEFWTRMLGVERMFALAGVLGGVMFWFISDGPHARGEVSA